MLTMSDDVMRTVIGIFFILIFTNLAIELLFPVCYVGEKYNVSFDPIKIDKIVAFERRIFFKCNMTYLDYLKSRVYTLEKVTLSDYNLSLSTE